jgi:hypothetical protein
MNRIALSLALVAGLALAGCGADAESREDAGSAAQNGEADAPSPATTPAPRANALAPVRATQPEPVRAIQAGTLLTFEVRENVSTSSNRAGDTFSLVLVEAVTGPGGASLPAGASARGLVTESRSSTGPTDPSLLGLRVTSVEVAGAQRPIAGETRSATIENSSRDSGTRTAATVATGAAAGAIVGQILGRDTRSTAAGAAVGAAVGVGVALTTRGGHAEFPTGSRIVVRLSQDLTF